MKHRRVKKSDSKPGFFLALPREIARVHVAQVADSLPHAMWHRPAFPIAAIAPTRRVRCRVVNRMRSRCCTAASKRFRASLRLVPAYSSRSTLLPSWSISPAKIVPLVREKGIVRFFFLPIVISHAAAPFLGVQLCLTRFSSASFLTFRSHRTASCKPLARSIGLPIRRYRSAAAAHRRRPLT